MYLHLGLNPGSDDVGLGSKLPPQPLIGLLSGNFLLEHLVSERHQLLHLQERHTYTMTTKLTQFCKEMSLSYLETRYSIKT